MPVVSVTRLHVRAWRLVPRVVVATLRAAVQAREAHGSLAVSVFSDTLLTYWTRTAWQDEASMTAYVLAGTHREILRHTLRWCDETSVVSWTDQSPELPSWPQAHLRLSKDGRHLPPTQPGDAPCFAMPNHRRWRELRIK